MGSSVQLLVESCYKKNKNTVGKIGRQNRGQWVKLMPTGKIGRQDLGEWAKLVGKIEASGLNGKKKNDHIQQPIIPLCLKLVCRIGETHIQGKDLDASLDLHWKAGASKNIRGEVACGFGDDTVVIFNAKSGGCPSLGRPVVIWAGAGPQTVSQ